MDRVGREALTCLCFLTTSFGDRLNRNSSHLHPSALVRYKVDPMVDTRMVLNCSLSPKRKPRTV